MIDCARRLLKQAVWLLFVPQGPIEGKTDPIYQGTESTIQHQCEDHLM